MQLSLAALLFQAAAAAAAAPETAPKVQKRCTPVRDEAYQQGYLPPAPCWQDFDTACRPHLAWGTEMYLSTARRTAVILGVSDACFGTIREEQARAADGRKTYGWEADHGVLTRAGATDVLVISGMTNETIQAYMALKYKDAA